MNATVTDQLGGLAWSEDPQGDNQAALRIDIEGDAPRSIPLPRRGPITISQFGDAESLDAVRSALLQAELDLGGPAVLRWKAYGSGTIDTSDARLIDDPLPWGGAPGRGLPQTPHPNDQWSRANAGEVIPNVMTPLSWSIIADPLDRGFHAPWGDWTDGRRFVALYDGYVYFNVGLMMELIRDRLGFSGTHFLEAIGGPEAADQVEAGGNGEQSTSIRWRTMLPHLPFMLRWLRDQDRMPARWPEMRRSAEAERDRLRALDAAALSDRQILRELSRSAAESERQTVFLMRAQSAVYGATQGLLWSTDRWLGRNLRHLSLAVLQGLPGVRTQDGNLALRRIAVRAASDAEAAAVVRSKSADQLWTALHSDALPAALTWLRDALDAFMAEYGHRAAGELEAAEPRWIEQPSLILDTFRDYVQHPEANNPDEMVERQHQERRNAEREIRSRLLAGGWLGRVRWLLFRAQIQQARQLQPLRENPKFSLLELSLQQRRLWHELADRWIERGVIANRGDIYYLLFEELATLTRRAEEPVFAARMRSRIRRRRRQFETWKQSPAVPLRDRSGDPITAQRAAPSASAPEAPEAPSSSARMDDSALPIILSGIAASTGRVEGRAHVADSATAGRDLTPGDILVARFTDPGWTPVFPLAAAVVTEIGGVLSHGAIVAREFGIPAVVNVQQVTTQIQSGDLLRVDGSSGQVTIVKRA